jgi:ubiquinone/menaquinone biosynthesis C-methylase UbiE
MYLKAGAAEETIFCETCADIVFFGIVLHDFRDPAKVLLNAKTMLKPTGRLIDLDWKKAAMELGPPLSIRFSEKKAVSLIRTAGFKIETAKETGPYHYLIIARPRITDYHLRSIIETG